MTIRDVREQALQFILENGLHGSLTSDRLAVSLNWIRESRYFRILYNSELNTLAHSRFIKDYNFWEIQLLTTASKAQRRMALAHEIGHIYLNHTPIITNREEGGVGYSFDGKDEFVHTYPPRHAEQEIEATHFAAYLLVPIGAVKMLFGFGWKPAQLAKKLNVPVELVRLRINLLQSEA
jgi:Zn-dependent peptidase ImmA (M78 family)